MTRLKKPLIVFTLLCLLGLLFRFYNFANRMTFSSEQGLALLTSGDYLTKGFSFLGQQTFLRTTSSGHIIFSGAIYNHSLTPLLKIFNYDPYPITIIFALINFLGGLVLYFVTRKVTKSKKIALFTFFFYLTSAMMIVHSMYIWILHYLPVVFGLTILSCFFVVRKKGGWLHPILLGLYSGLGVNFEYFYAFTLGLTFLWLLFFSISKLRDAILFILGSLLGNYTMVLFDLRHDFYNFRQLWQYLLDTINNPGISQIDHYHFFHFWPLIFLTLGVVANKLHKINKPLTWLLCLAYLAVNLLVPQLNFRKPVDMPDKTTLKTLDHIAKVIASDKPDSFNVVSLPDANFRAYALRYLVEFRHGYRPEGVENYASIDNLYVFGYRDFKEKYSKNPSSFPWEVTALGGQSVAKVAEIGSDYAVFKLAR